MTRALVWLCVAALSVGCTNGREARHYAAQLAASAGLQRVDIQTRLFHLVAYARFGAVPMLRVYIEGDGHAWTDRFTPSDDPTPWKPLALELAVRDLAPSVAYLGRPCQYVASGSDPACQRHYWTDGRYSEAAIASAHEAVDRLLAASGARSLELVGYSGGGAVAALVAARRHDVVSLRTVAANLDTAAWTAREGLAPLTGSLNPADFSDRLQNIAQIHFAGDADAVVHHSIARSYEGHFRRLDCIRTIVLPSVGHAEGVLPLWPDLLRLPIGCTDK